MSLYEYFDNLDATSLERYKQKLELLGISTCPYKLAHDSWEDNPTGWPPLEMTNLMSYLVKFPRVFQLEAMENYKSTDSHKYFLSGWVQTVLHQVLKTGFILMKADVRPSYRTNDPTHTPWIALNNKGSVIASHCNCMAG